jgi:HEAT repeat protein
MPATSPDAARNIHTVTIALIAALGQVKATDAVPALLEIVNQPAAGKRGGYLQEAMTALADIGDRSAVPPMIERLRKGPWNVKGDRFVNYTTMIGMNALVKMGDPRAVALFDEWTKKPPDEYTRDYAYTGLGKIACEEAITLLIGYLHDMKLDASIKNGNVATALAEQRGRARPQLVKMLVETPAMRQDQTHDPAIYAAYLLALLGREALPDLANVAMANTQKHVLSRAIEAIQRIPDDDAVPPLAHLTKNADANIRLWAVVGLGKIKRKAGLSAAQAVVKDKDPEVSKWAAWAIEQIGA